MNKKFYIMIIALLLIFLIPSNLIYGETGKVINIGHFEAPLIDGGIKSFVLKENSYYGVIGKYADNENYSETFILSYKGTEFSISFDPEKFGIEWGGLRNVKWANGGILKNKEEYKGPALTSKANNYSIPETFKEPLPDKIRTNKGSFKNQWKDGSPKVGFIPFGINGQNVEEYTEIPLGVQVQSEDERMSL